MKSCDIGGRISFDLICMYSTFLLQNFPRAVNKVGIGNLPGSTTEAQQHDIQALESLWTKLREKHKDYISMSHSRKEVEGSPQNRLESFTDTYIFNQVSQRGFHGRFNARVGI